jgi:hypothetical protein
MGLRHCGFRITACMGQQYRYAEPLASRLKKILQAPSLFLIRAGTPEISAGSCFDHAAVAR